MLILLPGIQAGPPELGPLAARLRGEVRVIPLPDTDADSLPAIAAALAARLPPGPHDVVGASFGGLVATALPPDRVRSLLTIGTLPWRTAAAERSGRAGRLLPWMPEAVFRRLYRTRVRDSLREDGADDELLAAVRLPSRSVLAARLRAIGGWALPENPGLRATWMWGATDPWVTWTVTDVRERGHEPVVVPGGHRPHLSHPSEVARWIEGWRERAG